jgi:hypothetical protein
MTCKVTKIPLVIYEGGTFDQTFQWQTGDPLANVDLTGFTAKFTIRSKLTDVEPLLAGTEKTDPWSADCDSGVYFDDAADGKYRLYINDIDTLGLCTEHKDIGGIYDLFLYSPAGESVLKQYGTAKLIAASTR